MSRKEALDKFLRDMERKGYVQQISSRLGTREPEYVITDLGRRMAVEKRMRGLLKGLKDRWR
ncbi:MAG: hypothetical protein K6T31_01910 [Alicyclobacillus sp.]|nr:hypothetical protein [Alicyclobacillus sp.]